LPPEHPVWFAQKKVDPTAVAPDFWMYGVQACCRTSVFYSPRSLSCRWELGEAVYRRRDLPENIQSQATAAISIGENVIAYATGRELKDKLESRFVIEEGADVDLSRGAIQIASLGIDAGGAEARRAVPNAAALVASRVPVTIRAVVDPVSFDAKVLADVQFLWIHGRTEFALTRDQRLTLRDFVESGGTILASAVCGSPPFADAFRREMTQIFPDSPLRAVPPNHPLIRAEGGFDISQVSIRTPADGGRGVSKRTGLPMIEVAMVDDVAGVFFSPLDLSCALESPNSIQCPGYPTEDAAKIVANLMLFSLQQ
jgi:hypothetical protein